MIFFYVNEIRIPSLPTWNPLACIPWTLFFFLFVGFLVYHIRNIAFSFPFDTLCLALVCFWIHTQRIASSFLDYIDSVWQLVPNSWHEVGGFRPIYVHSDMLAGPQTWVLAMCHMFVFLFWQLTYTNMYDLLLMERSFIGRSIKLWSSWAFWKDHLVKPSQLYIYIYI